MGQTGELKQLWDAASVTNVRINLVRFDGLEGTLRELACLLRSDELSLYLMHTVRLYKIEQSLYSASKADIMLHSRQLTWLLKIPRKLHVVNCTRGDTRVLFPAVNFHRVRHAAGHRRS